MAAKRFPFLDWMRGLAVVIMIQCHAFNSFVRTDLHTSGSYAFTQFVGGMAAPLFLFMAGMTFGFQMESLERREPARGRRWLIALRRAGYILAIAFLIRFACWVASLPHADPAEIIRVDILNTMGIAMAAFSVTAIFASTNRVRFALIAALLIAMVSPLIANLSWAGAPALVQQYLAPGKGRFPFFPTASYVGFGLALGTLVKRAGRLERLVQWSVVAGFVLVIGAHQFAVAGPSLYTKSDFWSDSPLLILIRVGISLLLLGGSYAWTLSALGAGWSWLECLGKNSLMVYWVHLTMVYGGLLGFLHGALTVTQAAVATLLIIVLMIGLSAAWLRWKARRLRTETK